MAHTNSSTSLALPALFSFTTHVVLITGGASGLGEMAAQAFIQNGARVIIASRKESELQRTSSRLTALGPGKCTYVVADLKDKSGCDKLVAGVKAQTDRLTVLVNNSGATWGAPYYEFPEAGWDKIMALNVKSLFYVTVGLEPLLRKSASTASPSKVINIASMAGIMTTDPTVPDSPEAAGLSAPGSGTYSYQPSKAAAVHLSRILASKLAPANVNVNCICPGVFPSKMTAFGLERGMAGLVERQPTGRIGTAEDFAGVVLFLSSRAGDHVVGNVIELDGGSTRSGWRAEKGSGKGKL